MGVEYLVMLVLSAAPKCFAKVLLDQKQKNRANDAMQLPVVPISLPAIGKQMQVFAV